MKTSCSWLKKYIDLPWKPKQLAEKLTMAGLEVEGIEILRDFSAELVIAEIIQREPHPNADKLSVCQVDDGSGQNLQVVCGAPNCDSGKKVVLARIGATLGEDFTIKKTRLRGVDSFGMLCSARELELSDDHSGILILPADAPTGRPLRDWLGIDTVIDWEVTPNRADWLSHLGIAREIAALSGNPLRLPDNSLDSFPTEKNPPVLPQVTVEAPDLCPRYTARLIRNVTIAPSPEWLQTALTAVGLRPINNIVDITNYVLFECGQPLHAFDFDKLAGSRIIVRRARIDETIATLDGTEHTLTPEHLLIADAEKGVALAGIMGGKNSEISEQTQDILLESAVFAASAIRATCKKLKTSSDSSYRFERGVDLEMAEFASHRAARLICELAGGTLAGDFIDIRAPQTKNPPISCRFARIRQLLGIQIQAAEILDIFRRLNLEILNQTDENCTVRAPSYRPDLTREVDLIEEVARLHGLDKIPVPPPKAVNGGDRQDDAFYPLQNLQQKLIALGLVECANYTMISREDALRRSGFADSELLPIANPLSSEFEILRPSLLSGMLRTVEQNISHQNEDLRLFELARVYANRSDRPEESLEAAILLSGRRHPERYSAESQDNYDLFDLKGLIEDLSVSLRLANVEFDRAEHPAFIAGTAGAVRLDGRNDAGVFGQVHPDLTRNMRLRHPLYLALLRGDLLIQSTRIPARHQDFSLFPATARDMAFVADQDLPHREILDVIQKNAGKLLEQVRLFDIYEDPDTIGAGKKSMAYSLTFRAPDRTLKDKEVDKIIAKISRRLQDQLPIEYR